MPLCHRLPRNLSVPTVPLDPDMSGDHPENRSRIISALFSIFETTIREGVRNTSFPVGHALNVSSGAGGDDSKSKINELQLIKVIVLVVVVTLLLLSTCKVVFKTFSRFGGKKDDM